MSYDKNAPSAYDGDFRKAADTHGVSYDLLRKLSFNESTFNPKAKSKTGPKGIMQFTTGTARELGLNVADVGIDDPNDDRYNAPVAIDAAARHLSDLVRKFNGDELKAALAYNQGEGANGKPQMAAYDAGDWGSISEEGRNYMRKLTDVAQSPRKGELEAFGGITPKGKGIPAQDAFAGLSTKGKVGTDLPQSQGFTFEGKEQAAPAVPFAKDFLEKTGTTIDEYEARGTFFGFGKAADAELSNSVLGVAFRAARMDNGYDVFRDALTPTRWNSYTPTKDELQKLRDSGLPPSYYSVVTGGDGENWDQLIKMAKENFKKDSAASEAGMGAKLSAGVIGAGVDPLSYIPLVGVAGKGIKVVNKALVVGVQSAGLNVASEAMRTSIAGGDAHYADAALGGLVFGAGMSALADGISAGLRKGGNPTVANEFAGPAMRLEARETAINTDGTDMSRMPSEDRVFDKEHNGVNYADHPTESGAVILTNGSILMDTNPANPKTIAAFKEIDPERAAGGVKLGGLTELGLKVLSSETPEVRGIGADLLRSPTGMQSGTSGKFGATASDIHERLHSADQRSYNQMYDAVREAMRDPEFTMGDQKLSREGVRQEVYKRAALAIERPELQSSLTPSELKVVKLMKEHFDAKREMMETPSMFGNFGATSIFPNSRHKGTYVPNVYDRSVKAEMVQRLGNEGLQEAIAKSWLTSYHSRPEVATRVREGLAEQFGLESPKDVTPAMVEKYAMDKAYGISHTEQFNSSSIIEDNIEGLVGIENNNFLEARNLFDSDMATTLPDGSTFSVNDLRDYDMFRIMPAYDRRVNGDIAIMGSSGKTTEQLKDELVALSKKAEGNGAMKSEVKALQDTVKILTGRARRDQDSVPETLMRSLNDMAFFSKNFFMGPQNVTEIAGMVAKGNVQAVLHGIPVVRDLAFKKSPVSGSELRELHSAVFGKELDMLVRPGREDVIQRLRETTDVGNVMSNVVGTLKYGTQELAARSPWTRMLNGTANYILDAARQGVLGDVAGAALGGKGSKFGKENFLKSASVSPEQWSGIKQLFKDHAVRSESGQFTIKDKKAFSQDPRAMDLWRLADKVADETMLRPHKVSNQDSVAYGALVKMALQFKNFTIKSLNSKFIRSYYESTKNNRAIDQALTHILSLGIAGGYFAMQAHVKAAGLPKEQQKDYLQKALNPTMLGYAAITRSSHLGAPFSIPSMIAGAAGFNDANMLRSTVLPKAEQSRDKNKPMTGREFIGNLGGSILSQMPAAGYVGSVGSAVYNAAGMLTAPNKPTEMDFRTGLMNATREMVPNDPLTQQLILKIYEANGVHIKQDPKPN